MSLFFQDMFSTFIQVFPQHLSFKHNLPRYNNSHSLLPYFILYFPVVALHVIKKKC